jgi:radical SAM family RiPP maturation amino acid epimerase
MSTSIKWLTAPETGDGALEQGAEIKPIFMDRATADPEYVSGIARTKRFLERWSADPAFREQVHADPYGLSARYGLEADPEEIRLLWDTEALARHTEGEPVPLAVRRYESFIREKLQFREVIRAASAPQEPRLKAWRRRQMYRAVSELGLAKSHGIVHAPVCFELAKGCSVGCWFCGVSAPKLEDIFLYTKQNALLWRETLEAVRDLLGPAAAHGFCYWATDPLDNPDYERFLTDFADILGDFPQTTTAIPMRDPARVRGLLKLSRERGGKLDRFSVLTLGILDKVHAEYSADELAFVELVTQNKGTIGSKAFAGRARKFDRSRAQDNGDALDDTLSGTVACVSGFLFNMVERTVRLVSPCNANERWSMGYRVYAQGTFNSGKDLRELLEKMIADNMPASVTHRDPVRFQRHLKYEELEDGFQVSSTLTTQTFDHLPHARHLGRVVADADKTAGEIALLLQDEHDIPLHETFHALNILFSNGVLDDEPAHGGN